jgi:purine-binding chemotaxis protein CheW
MSDGAGNRADAGQEPSADMVRAELERRAANLARVPPTVTKTESTDHVVFRVARETYAIPAANVSAVFKLTEMAVVPGAPEHVRGLALFKGQVLPVLDLRVLVGATGGALSDLARVVVVGGERGEFGLLADSIEGILPVDRAEVLPPPRQSDDEGSRYVAGMTRDAVLLLDAGALVRLFHGGAP